MLGFDTATDQPVNSMGVGADKSAYVKYIRRMTVQLKLGLLP